MAAFGEFSGLKEPKCPVCGAILRLYGDTIDYSNLTLTEHWVCDKCDYKRDKLGQLEK